MMKIVVIILNYNSFDDCRKCISFLNRQEGVDLELVVVDNCSQDRSKIEVFCQEQGCTFIASKENKGYNAGNNIGLHYAAEKGYKYAIIANPDMEFPQTDYVAKLISVMEKDTDVMVVGSDIIGPHSVHQNPLNFVSFWAELFWPIDMVKRKFLEKKNTMNNLSKKSGYCPMLSGCCFGIRMSFCKQINYFDESVFLYCEEPILAYQVKKSGYKLYYTKDCYAIHRHIKSSKGNPYKRFMILCDSRNYKNKYYSNYNFFQRGLLYITHETRKLIMFLMSKLYDLKSSK